MVILGVVFFFMKYFLEDFIRQLDEIQVES